MKKTFLYLTGLLICSATCVAQQIASKVPATAVMAAKYSGASLMQKLPAAKFDSYTDLKKKLIEQFQLGKNSSLSSIGFDLQQDAWQYMVTTDTSSCFVTMVAISNPAKFEKFIQKNRKKSVPVESKKGFRLYAVSNSSFLGWDGKIATFIQTGYTNNRYYQRVYTVDSSKLFSSAGQEYTFADSTISLEEAKSAAADAAVAAAVDSLAAAASAETMIDTAVVAYDSTQVISMINDMAAKPDYEYKESAEDKAYREASEKFYREQEIQNDLTRKALAENIFFTTYGKSIPSILNNYSYSRLVDKAADISIWVDSSNFYKKIFYSPSLYNRYDGFPNIPGFAQGVNIYFEPGRARIEQKIIPGNDSVAQLFMQVLNSKQNPAFLNYISATDLGYLSMSWNTEALVRYYYQIIRQVFNNLSYTKKNPEMVDAYVDILEIMLDEKGIGDALPGNVLFVLHDLKPKEVEYIDYEYDDEYKATETVKTKTELSPDFTFVFETRNEKIFNKLATLPVKLLKDGKASYTKTGDYYTLALGDKELVEKIYFMVKDGRCVITTSMADIKGQSRSANTALDATIKQSILNSNYSARLNTKGLVKSLSSDVTNQKNKEMCLYLQENAGDISFESAIKGEVVQTTAIINIAGAHKNSLEYFFTVINRLLSITASGK